MYVYLIWSDPACLGVIGCEVNSTGCRNCKKVKPAKKKGHANSNDYNAKEPVRV